MLKLIIPFLIILNGITMSQDNNFIHSLSESHSLFCEKKINDRRFKHKDIVPLIKSLKNNKDFIVKKAGESVNKRDIYLISWGTGPKKIFMWSQMHGDESTATMAMLDIFNFLKDNEHFKEFKDELKTKVTLYFMPMVNPDGAEVFKRRNYFDIDINRDAIRQQTPEGITLRKTFDSLKADFGFNLHDQQIYYTTGINFKSAALSFLAPAPDYGKTVTPVRERAMKLIGKLFTELSTIIPGHIGKYNDDHETRAFGDNFQKWGTSTILIETGGWKDDSEKQFLRKLNFIALISSFKGIMEESYNKYEVGVYDSIPFNEEYLKDVILKNVTYELKGKKYLVDVAILREEKNNKDSNDYYFKSSIDDIGDLSVFSGYEEYDLTGMTLEKGQTYSKRFSHEADVLKQDINKLYKKGYTNVIVKHKPDEKFTRIPFNLVEPKYKVDETLNLDESADFIIKQNGKVKYVMVNGFLYDVDNNLGEIKNGVVK